MKKSFIKFLVFIVACGIFVGNILDVNAAEKSTKSCYSGEAIPLCSYRSKEHEWIVRIKFCQRKATPVFYLMSTLQNGNGVREIDFGNIPSTGKIDITQNSFSTAKSDINHVYISRPAYENLLKATKDRPKGNENSKYCPEYVYGNHNRNIFVLARSEDGIKNVQKEKKSVNLEYSLNETSTTGMTDKQIKHTEEANEDVGLNLIERYKKPEDIKLNKATCDTLLGSKIESSDPAYYINSAFNLVKYVAIIILIVFTSLDFLKAVVSKDDDAISKSTTFFVKRLILAVIIFTLPTLVVLMLQWGGLINDPFICGIGG